MGNRRKRNAGSGGNKETSVEVEVNEYYFRMSKNGPIVYKRQKLFGQLRSKESNNLLVLYIKVDSEKAVREWGILEVLKRTLGVPLQGPPTQKSEKSITPMELK